MPLAKAAGISKGGVQYSFSSKDELIKGLIDRWTDQFDTLVVDIEDAGPIAFVRSYIAAMRSSQEALDAKLAGLMIAYMQNPQNRMETTLWYRSILGQDREFGRNPCRADRLSGRGRTDADADFGR